MFRTVREWWTVWRRFGVTPWQLRKDRRHLRAALEALRRMGSGPRTDYLENTGQNVSTLTPARFTLENKGKTHGRGFGSFRE
jgi:hypothetical protein